MKCWLGGDKFDFDSELQTGIDNWLKVQASAFHRKVGAMYIETASVEKHLVCVPICFE